MSARNYAPLLNLPVNVNWDETAATLNNIDAATDDVTVVNNFDNGIVTANELA